MERLENHIEAEQKAIFKLIDNRRLRDTRVDIVERLEKKLAMLYDKHYAIGSELDQSAGRIVNTMQEQIDAKSMMA
jgi:hypothetical protein